MLIGDPAILALASEMNVAYESPGLRGLGFFVIHAGGVRFGVEAPDATLLANSYDRILELLTARGTHVPPFSPREDAGVLARVVSAALYDDAEMPTYLGWPRTGFTEHLYSSGVVWAPDGDAAFDDGGHVLLFDLGASVRVVGFRHLGGGRFDDQTVREAWMASDAFYALLQEWSDALLAAWHGMPKSREA